MSRIQPSDLCGRPMEPSHVELILYADEIKEVQNCFGERWAYIGILAVPAGKWQTALGTIQNSRGNHDHEVHFQGLRDKTIQSPKVQAAGRWLDLILNDQAECFWFYVLGINLSNLCKDAFADRKAFSSIYNRFFRTATSYVLNGYFGQFDRVRVAKVFHDAGNMEHDDYFDWHTIWKIGSDPKNERIEFPDALIEFVDSDHRKEKRFPDHSHFIQLIDVILGTTEYLLDCRHPGKGADYLAERFFPLVDRLTDEKRRRNPNSRYRYFRKYSVSFFPSERLSFDQIGNVWARAGSTFYHGRRLRWREMQSGQEELGFQWG